MPEPQLASSSGSSVSPNELWPLWLLITGALLVGTIVQNKSPAYCPNDGSRWNTVYYLVEHGTYEYLPNHGAWWSPEEYDHPTQIPPFWTIDMIRVVGPDGEDHYYSSKPPLLPTMVAGVVWLIEQASFGAADFKLHPWFITRTALIIVHVIPLLVMLWIVQGYINRATDSLIVRNFCLAAAALGTYLTAYAITLNNHVAAAVTAMLAIHAGVRIWYDGHRAWYWFAMAGFFGAMTPCLELPAGLLAVALLVALLYKDPRRTLLIGVPAAAMVTAAALFMNDLAVGRIKPAYMDFGKPGGFYDYPGSYWLEMRGIDALAEPKWWYLFNMLLGHHGFFLLTPIFFLCLRGMYKHLRRPRDEGHFPLLALFVLGLFTALVTLYTIKTNNYGGGAEGFRWLFWVTPLWLIFLPSGVKDLLHRRASAVTCYVLLGVSVMTVGYGLRTPWDASWAHILFKYFGLIDY